MSEKLFIRQVVNPTEDTIQHAGTLLGTAFELDPLTLPLLGGNRALAALQMEANFKCGVLGGSAYVASNASDHANGEDPEALGAAIWYGPGQDLFDIASKVEEQRIITAQLIPEALEWRNNVFFPLFKSIHDRHFGPDRLRDLYYLQVLGVHPSARRRGVASALVRHVLDIADKEGIEVALETCTAPNIKLYESLGFKALGQTRIPSVYGDIDMTCMLRPVGGRLADSAGLDTRN